MPNQRVKHDAQKPRASYTRHSAQVMSHSDTIKTIRIAVGVILLVASNAFAERPRDYLGTIDLEDLCITYSENHQGFWVAGVKDLRPAVYGRFHTVIVGSEIGRPSGVITKITNDTVEVLSIILDESTGDYVERSLTLEVACPMSPPRAKAPSDGSHIRWLITLRDPSGSLGFSVGDCRMWRWVDGEGRGIQPATSEEAKELKEEYGDFSRFLNDPCPTPR